MHLLHNSVQHYAWGSRTHIAELCGRDFEGERVAEMWFGAHPQAPSRLDTGIVLSKAIAEAPEELLGTKVSTRHGERLPFLLKLLAADEPLSLQVHPGRRDAAAGFDAEVRAGIPVDAFERSFRDRSHKPELVYALTDFTALVGFRNPVETVDLLRGVGADWADDLAETLAAPGLDLRAVVSSFFALGVAEIARRTQDVRHSVEGQDTPLGRVVRTLTERHPKDPGTLVALLLNVVDLAPGEAAFIGPGVVHSHIGGFAVEIQASSDNVVRAGLTAKHVDVDLLMRTATFTTGPAARVAPLDGGPCLTRFAPPVEEFVLEVVTPSQRPVLLEPHGPRIVLCLEATVEVSGTDGATVIAPGQAVFLTHGEAAEVHGDGRAVVARVPQ